MNTPQNFLIAYGLHNFVTHKQEMKQHTFFINNTEGQKMASHAINLITENFGGTSNIQMV